MFSKDELKGLIKPTNLGNPPINPKTNMPYTKKSKKYWVWYYGLSENDRNIIADLEFHNQYIHINM